MSDLIKEMQFEDYLKYKAYSSSDIIAMAKSFAYWKYKKENPPKPSRAMIIGSVVHSLLEKEFSKKPHKQEILCYQDGSSKTKGFEKFSADNKSAFCVDLEELATCNRAVKAILEEPQVLLYLEDALVEPTIMGNYPGTNVLCKCRPDYLHQKKGVSINIKTTTDASESGFIYSSKDFYYDFQSAFYIDLLTDHFQKSFDEIHVLIEKSADDKEPPIVAIRSFGDETIQWARAQIHSILCRIPDCEKTGVWPKKDVFLETVELPLYARKVVFP